MMHSDVRSPSSTVPFTTVTLTLDPFCITLLIGCLSQVAEAQNIKDTIIFHTPPPGGPDKGPGGGPAGGAAPRGLHAYKGHFRSVIVHMFTGYHCIIQVHTT